MEPVRLQKLSLEPRINLSFKSGELDSPALLVASELLLNFGQGNFKQWSCVAQVQCRGLAFEFESKLVPAPALMQRRRLLLKLNSRPRSSETGSETGLMQKKVMSRSCSNL